MAVPRRLEIPPIGLRRRRAGTLTNAAERSSRTFDSQPGLRVGSSGPCGPSRRLHPALAPAPTECSHTKLRKGTMPPPPEGYSWKSLESATLDEDVTLQVTDGHGKPYILVNASRLTAAGWVSAIKGTPLAVTPVAWRRYFPAQPPTSMTPMPPRSDGYIPPCIPIRAYKAPSGPVGSTRSSMTDVVSGTPEPRRALRVRRRAAQGLSSSAKPAKKSRSATLPTAVAVYSDLKPSSRRRAGSGSPSRQISQLQGLG
jgi:hypothetical protein